MDEYIRTLRKEELLSQNGGFFDKENAERVVSWLVAAEDRIPVVLVGAGFSLNARDARNGRLATRDQAPLWNDIVTELAGELAVSPTRYDAPTLFEMYEEAFGSAKLRDRLRQTVSNDNLVPGDAHRALANYSCAAIVTMNCLDTLLDRACNAGWCRVVDDADLSSSGSMPQLIYFHGHRDAPQSWVMTRAQYEDIARSKPVIATRVRQLLAQHPWVVVGYSLSDPDFHSMTRVLGNEMRGHQPLSLVVARDQPSAPERQHWRKIGFEIATPEFVEGRSTDFGGFLSWIFPKLATTYSPTSDAARDYVARGIGLDEQLRRFRRVYPPPLVDRQRVFNEWESQLKSMISSEEWIKIRENAKDTFADVSSVKEGGGAGGAHLPSLQSRTTLPVGRVFNGFESMPRFRSSDCKKVLWYVECLMSKGEKFRGELSEHFAWAVKQRVFDESSPSMIFHVLSARLADDAGWGKERVQSILHAAMSSAKKYRDFDGLKVLESECHRLKIELASPETNSVESYLEHAENAARFQHELRFVDAAKSYAEAAKDAIDAGNELAAWTYCVGQLSSLRRLDNMRSNDPQETAIESASHRRAEMQRLSEEIDRLAKCPSVEHWTKQADARSQRATRDAFDISRNRERCHLTGRNVMRFSSAANDLQRSLHELVALSAPPSLQSKYLENLLPFLDAEDAEAAIFGASNPREWVEDVLRRRPRTVDDRRRRDADLMGGFLDGYTAHTKEGRMARMEVVPALRSVFRNEDVGRIQSWFIDACSDNCEWRFTDQGQRRVESPWKTLPFVVRWSSPEDALHVAQMVSSHSNASDPSEISKALYNLPWGGWRLRDGNVAAEFFRMVTNSTKVAEPESNVSFGGRRADALSYSVFAALRMLDAGFRLDDPSEFKSRWIDVLESIRTTPSASYSDLRRASFLLEQKLTRRSVSSPSDEANLYAKWFANLPPDVTDRSEAWSVLCEIVEPGMNAIEPLLEQLGVQVDAMIESHLAISFYKRNSHMSALAVRLLAKGISCLECKRSAISPVLLELLESAPEQVDELQEVLRREMWDEVGWNRLMSVVFAACSGQVRPREDEHDAGLQTRCQLAALGLFGELSDRTLQRTAPWVWHGLQGLALASVSDERSVVANFAAFAIVNSAQHVDDEEEARRYATAINRIALDSRVEVQVAIADAGLRLRNSARHDIIRESARVALEMLLSDENNAHLTWIATNARRREEERS